MMASGKKPGKHTGRANDDELASHDHHAKKRTHVEQETPTRAAKLSKRQRAESPEESPSRRVKAGKRDGENDASMSSTATDKPEESVGDDEQETLPSPAIQRNAETSAANTEKTTSRRLKEWVPFVVLREVVRRTGNDIESYLPEVGPRCQSPGCLYPFTKLNLASGGSRIENTGRPYYKCFNNHFLTWADLKDVDGPDCYCDSPSRRDVNRQGRTFWKCAGADCKFSKSEYVGYGRRSK